MRKSPYKHNVRKHTRKVKNKTVSVTTYERGKGKQQIRRIRRKLTRLKPKKKPKEGVGSFSASISYVDFSSESVNVSAKDFPNALNGAIETRKQIKIPVKIRLRRR